MKTAIRTRIAAAVVTLLVPMGAALVAEPAFAQYSHRVATARPAITSVAVNSDQGLRPGATLHVQVQGTPGARWSNVSLGDSGVRIALREQAGGLYTGSYVVRHADRIDASEMMTVRAGYGEDRVVLERFGYPPELQAHRMGNAPAVAIVESLKIQTRGGIVPGRVLTFVLEGAPRGKAVIDVPGVVQGLHLMEVRPGIYERNYTVRANDPPGAFERAVATLRFGNREASTRLTGGIREQNVARGDNRPPLISDVSPGNGDRLTQGDRGFRVFARLSDGGSGIDAASVRLLVDGRDVTGDARISASEVRFRDDLPRGRHTAELVVRDRAGNVSRTTWAFEVV